jgi:hypothetical protein
MRKLLLPFYLLTMSNLTSLKSGLCRSPQASMKSIGLALPNQLATCALPPTGILSVSDIGHAAEAGVLIHPDLRIGYGSGRRSQDAWGLSVDQ